MIRQAYNPYLPLNAYIPDGEPHVFGNRVYVYGSHDREGGSDFCIGDYEVWSAPVDDLTNWTCPGAAYCAKQDPHYTANYNNAMFAPDCVQGKDGRYYLYYALSGGHFTDSIHVAVSQYPDRDFQYYGAVHEADGREMITYITFDPAVFNDDGTFRLYYGWSLEGSYAKKSSMSREQLMQAEMMLFQKTKEELEASPEDIMGANTVALMDDMLTIRHFPRRIVPGGFSSEGTSFAEHPFFEASSMRKIGDTYYFIYSSDRQHELCYATSRYPDRNFVFGGVLISNGDLGYHGQTVKQMLTGNNHGSLVQIKGQWYLFYHRQTHKNTYSRQGCAEKITILPDGRIPQVQMTSCGLNQGALVAEGSYPAPICCCLTNGHMPHACREDVPEGTPIITHEGQEHFLDDLADGVTVGYRFFAFHGETMLTLTLRGTLNGTLTLRTEERKLGKVHVLPCERWTDVSLPVYAQGDHALYMDVSGAGKLAIKALSFSPLRGGKQA